MTTYFIDAAAVGTGTGLTKANAFITASAAFTAITEVTGDIFQVAHTHVETLSAALNSSLNAGGTNKGIRFTSINFATDAPTLGARFICGANAFQVYGVVEFVHLDNSTVANDLTIQPGVGTEYIGCKFSKQPAQSVVLGTSAGASGLGRDCEIAAGTAYTALFATGGVNAFRFDRLTISGSKGSNVDLVNHASVGNSLAFVIANSDCSGCDNLTDSAVGGANSASSLTFISCILPASYEIDDGGNQLARKSQFIRLIRCKAGTLTAPVIEDALYVHEGECVKQGTVFRQGGMSDGTTPHSLAHTAYSGRTWKQTNHAAKTPPEGINFWAAAGVAITIKAFLAHNAVGAGAAGALNDDECWMRITGPDSKVSPDAAGFSTTSMRAAGGTPDVIPADAVSTWTGSSIGTKQVIALTYTPTVAGVVRANLFYAHGAAADRTVYASIEKAA